MKKKILVIGILVLLITFILPSMNAMQVEENEVLHNGPWIKIGFVRGEIENIREEYTNSGRLFYNCTAVDVKITWFTYILPLNFTIDRVTISDTDWFAILDDSFIGILRDGLIFGIIYSAGL